VTVHGLRRSLARRQEMTAIRRLLDQLSQQ
jgi:hypothetical protein